MCWEEGILKKKSCLCIKCLPQNNHEKTSNTKHSAIKLLTAITNGKEILFTVRPRFNDPSYRRCPPWNRINQQPHRCQLYIYFTYKHCSNRHTGMHSERSKLRLYPSVFGIGTKIWQQCYILTPTLDHATSHAGGVEAIMSRLRYSYPRSVVHNSTDGRTWVDATKNAFVSSPVLGNGIKNNVARFYGHYDLSGSTQRHKFLH
jgi:hypothetical protein